jgi:hypothetical protein
MGAKWRGRSEVFPCCAFVRCVLRPKNCRGLAAAQDMPLQRHAGSPSPSPRGPTPQRAGMTELRLHQRGGMRHANERLNDGT